MNFTIYADDQLIYNRKIIGEFGDLPYNVLSPTLSLTANRFGSLTFSALKGSPAYEYISHLSTQIKVYLDRNLYWTGRVIDVAPSADTLVSITCEDLLGTLNNTIVRPYSWNGAVKDFLTYLVNQHNSQLTDARFMISAVACDIEDSIIRSSTLYEKTWQAVKSKLLDMIGGYMWIEYDDSEKPVLYYSRQSKSEIHEKNVQKVKFARNIITYNVSIKADNLYTACVPLGCKLDTGDEEILEPRLTITDVNDGKDYLINSAAAAIYGVIFAPVSETTWDDVTLASNLLARGQSFIQNSTARFIRSINVSSVDMSGIEAEVAAFDWLDKAKCEAPDFDEFMIIKELRRDLGDPYNVNLSFGDAFESLSGKSASSAADTATRITAIEADYVTTGEARVVAEETIENSSTIQQLPEQILSTVSERYTSKSEFTEFSQLTQTQISQLPNEFQILFTQVLEGAGLTELTAYLRVLNGNLHLGKSNSEIKACLKNDILLFYTGADELASVDTAISYYAAGKLYVKTVQIESLTIGKTGAEFDIRIVGGGRNRCLFFSGRGE